MDIARSIRNIIYDFRPGPTCCNAMKKEFKRFGISKDYLYLSFEDGIMDKIKYCPFCGEKVEVIDESTLPFV